MGTMKSFVPLSLLLVGMAKGQEVDATSLNKILPKGFTKVCEDGEGPEPKSLSKRQVQTARDAPPCWTLVDEDFDKTQCSSFENTCDTRKPYVGAKQNTMCIFFPKAGKWFKLSGTYGWCVLTTAVISTIRDNANLPGLWQLISACLLVLKT